MRKENSPDRPQAAGSQWAEAVLVRSVVYGSVFGISFFLFLNQLLDPLTYQTDLYFHVGFAKEFQFPFFFRNSHPGFQFLVSTFSDLLRISHECAAVIILSTTVVITLHIIDRILASSLGKTYSPCFLLCMSTSLILVSAIYMPFFNPKPHLGQASPNVWHNPTFILCKPFALIAFDLFPGLIGMKSIRKPLANALLVSFMLLYCTAIKPNFALAFLPAAGLYVLVRHSRDLPAYVLLGIVALPTLLLLWIEFKSFGGQPGSGIEVAFLKVMSLRTPNVWVSTLLTTAFPLSVLVLRPRRVIVTPRLLLAWILLAISLFQWAAFAEVGSRMADGNLSWGYQAALQIVFLYSAVEMLAWLKEAEGKRWTERFKVTTVTALFSAHLVSGVYYLGKYLAGKGFE